tara:strand:- start:214581 stop:215984 length:1404 start_codon:yes stop_codon:yes gene_type:complete
MLNSKVLSLAVAASERMGSKIQIPAEDTLLNVLVARSLPKEIPDENISPLGIADLIQQVSGTANLEGGLDHSTYLANVISTLTQAVRPRIDLMRKSIRLAYEAGDRIENVVNRGDIGLYDIHTFELPIAMRDSYFISLVDEYSSTTESHVVSWRPGMPRLEEDQLADIIKTGTKIDECIINTLAEMPSGGLGRIYDKFFYTATMYDQPNAAGNRRMYCDEKLSAEYVIALMLTIGLESKLKSDIEMGANDYVSMLNTIRGTCAKMLSDMMSDISRSVNNGRLIKSYDATAKVVVVYEEVYDQYIAEGGSPEIIQSLIPMGFANLVNKQDIINSIDTIAAKQSISLEKLEAERINSIRVQVKANLNSEIEKIWVSNNRDEYIIEGDVNEVTVAAHNFIDQCEDKEIDGDLGYIIAQAIVTAFWPTSRYVLYMNLVDHYQAMYRTETRAQLEYRATVRWLVEELARMVK